MTKQSYVVVKTKLNRDQLDIRPSFKRVGQLYLELLENKSKIQPHLVNVEYKPSIVEPNTSTFHRGDNPKNQLDDDLFNKMDSLIEPYSNTDSGGQKELIPNTNIEHFESSNNVQTIEKPSEDGSNIYTNEKPSNYNNSITTPPPPPEEKHQEQDVDDLFNNVTQDRDNPTSVEEKLQHILSNDDNNSKYTQPKQTPSFGKTSYNDFKQNTSKPPLHPQVPSFSELQRNGDIQMNKTLRNAEITTLSEQQIEDKKRETIFKFQLLKKSYPAAELPEYTIHSDLNMMQRSYESHVRRLSLDSTVETYKTYLTGSFMLIQYVFGKFLKFDMDGYAQQQIMSMNSYERLLIELGEKTYVPSGSKWPVEVRLVFLVLINTAFFIISKMIMKSTGANLINMINGMNTATSSSGGSSSSTSKRKMKGPTINMDDL